MPLRTAAIRRCSFKLPKNDKYLCQKAGNKFQPIVELWYCTRHDSHAQDRCKILVEWAGKGAQCEQLGVFDKRSLKKLCERHLSQATGHDRPETKSEQYDNLGEGSIDQENVRQDTVKTDDAAPDHPTPSPTSHSDEIADAVFQLSLTDIEPQRPLNSIESDAGTDMSEQELPTEEPFSNARTSLSDSDSTTFKDEKTSSASTTMDLAPTPASQDDKREEDGLLIAPQSLVMDYRLSEAATANLDLGSRLEAGSCGDLTAPTAEGEHAPTLLPDSGVSRSSDRSHCSIAPCSKTVQETRSKGPVETPRHLGRAPHVRTDSLSPFTPILLSGAPEVNTPDTPTRNAPLGSGRSTQSFETAHGATTTSPSIQARITNLHALQYQGPSGSDRIAAAYTQCCVCLEKHGEHNMREVATCKHRYRDLCLKKAVKAGSLRRFNCSSCRAWMAKQREEMTDSGKL